MVATMPVMTGLTRPIMMTLCLHLMEVELMQGTTVVQLVLACPGAMFSIMMHMVPTGIIVILNCPNTVEVRYNTGLDARKPVFGV